MEDSSQYINRSVHNGMKEVFRFYYDKNRTTFDEMLILEEYALMSDAKKGHKIFKPYKISMYVDSEKLTYYCDNKRHIVCRPYSLNNLHRMARDLGIKRCWFHKDHYDMPKNRIGELASKCRKVPTRLILSITKERTEEFFVIGTN